VASFVERAQMAGHMEVTAGGRSVRRCRVLLRADADRGRAQDDEIVKREVFGPVVS
jgi:aminobutyraldehyde dehydrogenase